MTFKLVIVFCSLLTLSRGFIVHCILEDLLLFDEYKLAYSCETKDLTTTKDMRNITGIEGDHGRGKSHKDVTQLYISHQNMEYFPRGFPSIFNNIGAIHAGKRT